MAISRETLKRAAELRAAVADITDSRTRTLAEAWVRAFDEVAPALAAGIDDALTLADQGRWPSRAQIVRSRRLMHALDLATAHLEVLARDAGVAIGGDASAAATAGATAQPGLIASQMPAQAGTVAELSARFDRMDPRALEAIVTRTTQQVTALTYPISQDAYQAMLRELIRGVAVGDNPREAARRMVARVEGKFNGGLGRALTISRTETNDSMRVAAAAAQNANSDVLSGWVWSSSLSRTTCPACWSKHGTLHPLSEPGPLGHQNCVTAGALVTGPRAEAATARWFDGEVIDLEVDGGRRLTVTPNHPILTAHGWVAAGLLREGDNVICGSGSQGIPAVGNPDDHQVPTLIEDVAETLRGSPLVDSVRVPTAAEDFHGDGAGSDVHVVWADGLLRKGLDASFSDPAGEHAFLIGDEDAARFASDGASLVRYGFPAAATDSLVRGPHDLAVLLRRPSVRDEAVRLGLAAQGHTCVLEADVDRTAHRAVGLRESVRRFAGQVPAGDLVDREWRVRQQTGTDLRASERFGLFPRSPQASLDQGVLEPVLARSVPSRGLLAAFAGDVGSYRVLHVSRRSFRGHVYNLQTGPGWYLANSIVTHNCRCSRTPQSKSWRALGFNIDEPRSLLPDARTVFKGLPEADQLAVMGPARLAALDSGRASWDDLSMRRTTPGWRDSYAPRPARDFAA